MWIFQRGAGSVLLPERREGSRHGVEEYLEMKCMLMGGLGG